MTRRRVVTLASECSQKPSIRDAFSRTRRRVGPFRSPWASHRPFRLGPAPSVGTAHHPYAAVLRTFNPEITAMHATMVSRFILLVLLGIRALLFLGVWPRRGGVVE